MKELSIEEKAKAYDEALARANEMIKSITNIGGVAKVDDIQHIFPELKESDDERIRGNIIATIHLYYGEPLEDEAKEMIAWLEKQGEQKIKTPEESLGIDSDTYNKIVDECIYGEQNPIDKVEPNFKVGDWVIWDNKIPCHVDNIYQGKNSLMYTITDTNNMTRSYSVKGFDNNAHLWTIQDARNGDILCSNQIIVLFKQWEDNTGYTFVIAHAGIDISGKLQITNGHWLINNKSKPATKEQRDTLMKAMADAGYAFDFEKKELKEIENEEYDGDDYGIDSLWHAIHILKKTLGKVDGYQSDDGILEHKCAISAVDKLYKHEPTWCAEDRFMVQRICKYLDAAKKYYVDSSEVRECIDWLKSIKERFTWKPS